MRSGTPTPPDTDRLSLTADDELLRRLDSLAAEYDGFVREVVTASVKAAHVRAEIESIVSEMERRKGAA